MISDSDNASPWQESDLSQVRHEREADTNISGLSHVTGRIIANKDVCAVNADALCRTEAPDLTPASFCHKAAVSHECCFISNLFQCDKTVLFIAYTVQFSFADCLCF